MLIPCAHTGSETISLQFSVELIRALWACGVIKI